MRVPNSVAHFLLLVFAAIALPACATTPKTKTRSDIELRSNCDRGYLPDCRSLGVRVAWGSGPKNYDWARSLLTRACDGGDVGGCCYLGAMYENGLGVPRDPAHALSIYRPACDLGSALGCVHLGRLYEQGLGIEKDVTRARALFTAACEQTPGNAATGWGCAKLARLVKSESAEDAKRLSQKSCDLGNAEGCIQVASDAITTGSNEQKVAARKKLEEMCNKDVAESCEALRAEHQSSK